MKWSLKDENRAIQDALTQVGELFSIWSEVQREFSEHMKDFKHQFDMILEGAKQLDLAKTDLQSAEVKEGKLKKELKKAAKKATTEELREMSLKLSEAEREKDLAQLEVVDRVREHEAVKMIRIKEGLFKISEAYIDYAQKCDVIFGAQRDIALQIPDVHDKDIQDIKYTGRSDPPLMVLDLIFCINSKQKIIYRGIEIINVFETELFSVGMPSMIPAFKRRHVYSFFFQVLVLRNNL